MIDGFEKETAELNDFEKNVADIVADSMIKSHTGEDRIISSEKILSGLAKNASIKIDGPRLRKIINYLRTSGKCAFIMSNSKGYYVATNAQQVLDCIKSLRERQQSIGYLADRMEYHLHTVCPELAGELKK